MFNTLQQVIKIYCLSNMSHSQVIQKYWKELYLDKYYHDVTLACDGKFIEAHRVVLSSNSPLFRNVLKDTTDNKPLLQIPGVNYRFLKNLVSFMYSGNVSVAQEDLGLFLAVAKDLQIKGLSGENGKSFSLTFQSPSKIDFKSRT